MKGSLSFKIVIIVLIVLVVGAAGFFGYRHFHNQKRTAVFMTNGQVYFGYLKNANNSIIHLNDVYYLKTSDLQNSTNSKILLVKMGNELHGPQSNMTINRSQVLFWQTLKDSSKINDAISRFNQGATPTPSPTPTPSSS